jgi:hypothetical protein
LPWIIKAVPGKDGLEMPGVDRAGLDELKQARLVLGPSGLERDGGKKVICYMSLESPGV